MLDRIHKLLKLIEYKRYFGGYAIYEGRHIRDKDAALYAIKHLHWWDRLDPRKVGEATLVSWHILAGVFEPDGFTKQDPSKDDWKFY